MAKLDAMNATLVPGSRAWENLCRRCGHCCHEKIEYEGEVYYTESPCEMLDPASGLCRVYPDRQRARPGCVPLTPELLQRGLLPADCPYVAGLEDYRAPHLWEEE